MQTFYCKDLTQVKNAWSVSALLICVSCVNLEGKDRCQTDNDCIKGYVCGEEKHCQKGEVGSDDGTCSSGVCCDESNHFRGPSDTWCEQTKEYQCIFGTCGPSRQQRVVERHCSGLSAECDGELSDSGWVTMPGCPDNTICRLNDESEAVCHPCGAHEICQLGECSCAFETCLGECCAAEETQCGWAGTCSSGEHKLIPSEGEADDYFGQTVSASADVVLIGAYGDDQNGLDSGAAFIFERNGSGNWKETAKLLPAVGDEDDRFGYAVSVSGNVAIIGATKDDDNGPDAGAAYIFERNGSGGWVQTAKLLPAFSDEGDRFGNAVSVSGNVAIVGADQEEESGERSGSAYIFERDDAGGWVEKTRLLPADGSAFDRFGHAVSISGEYAIVGAPDDYDNGKQSGSVYFFERGKSGSWIQKCKRIGSDADENHRFGQSVSIEGKVAIVGANGDNENGENSGAAYIFERGEDGIWKQIKNKLLASDGGEGDDFGRSVTVSGDLAIIGAPGKDENGEDSGSIYVFARDTSGNWEEKKDDRLPTGREEHESFGQSVSASGDVALVGGPGYDRKESGFAYVF